MLLSGDEDPAFARVLHGAPKPHSLLQHLVERTGEKKGRRLTRNTKGRLQNNKAGRKGGAAKKAHLVALVQKPHTPSGTSAAAAAQKALPLRSVLRPFVNINSFRNTVAASMTLSLAAASLAAADEGAEVVGVPKSRTVRCRGRALSFFLNSLHRA